MLTKKEKIKGKKKANMLEVKSNVRGIFGAHFMSFFLSVFSPFWGKSFLVGSGRKHLNSTIYFPSSPPNQTYSKKVSISHFLSKIFYQPYFASKQTHP